MYVRKTVDRYYIETNYGYGWEEEDVEEDYFEAKRIANEYRMINPKPQVRIVKRREKKE